MDELTIADLALHPVIAHPRPIIEKAGEFGNLWRWIAVLGARARRDQWNDVPMRRRSTASAIGVERPDSSFTRAFLAGTDRRSPPFT